MQRIAEGVRRHGSEMLEPFADALANIGRDEVFEMRENVVPAADAELVARSVSDPFLVKYYGTSSTRPVTEPLDTVTSGGQKFALCTPYVLGQHGGARAKPVTDNPLPTVASRGAISKFTASPFVLPKNGKQRGLFSNKIVLGESAPHHRRRPDRPRVQRDAVPGPLLRGTLWPAPADTRYRQPEPNDHRIDDQARSHRSVLGRILRERDCPAGGRPARISACSSVWMSNPCSPHMRWFA